MKKAVAPRFVFHLLPNAHLDPVWLWDWREGLNEGLITCRTILDLMDEIPDLTFMRGESAIYQHIERTDPRAFERIRRYVESGRWEVVGGTYVQADTNLPATETFARHLLHGQQYFRKTFRSMVRAAWAADSFGHAGGLPEIYAKAGIDCFAFTRGGTAIDQLKAPLFWWEGTGGSRILSYHPMTGWYGTEREEIQRRLDGLLEDAVKRPLKHVGVFCGLGNHGGGPTRRQVELARRWAEAHPEMEVRFSTLHGFFDALRDDLGRQGLEALPVVKGELNFCLRGCYASVAKLKYFYRRAEAAVGRAERVQTALSAAVPGVAGVDLHPAWEAILFNSFHDILPGTSIERGYEDQLAWLGGAVHAASCAEVASINALAAKVDTTVEPAEGDRPTDVAAIVFNPHPHEYEGYLELEANMDYRPIRLYCSPETSQQMPVRLLSAAGEPMPLQIIATECHAMVNNPWRRRVVAPVKLPAMGWQVLRLGWHEDAPETPAPADPAGARGEGVIFNSRCRIEAKVGAKGVQVRRDGKGLFGRQGLSAALFEDTGGSWGGGGDGPEHIDKVARLETWRITDRRILEKGPHRARLWVRLQGKRSWMELDFLLCAGSAEFEVRARVLINERSARLKLIMPVGDKAEFDIPGGSIERSMKGELPGGRWVRVRRGREQFVFASDALYGFDLNKGCLRATVARVSRYAADQKAGPKDRPWEAAVDCGELKFRMHIGDGSRPAWRQAAELERPPLVQLVAPRKGRLPREASLLSLSPANVELVALKPAEDGRGMIVRVLERAGRRSKVSLVMGGRRLTLGSVMPGELATWRLRRTAGGWSAGASSVTEV